MDDLVVYVIFNSISARPGPEVIKLFSCSTQMSMKFFLLINVKMPTIMNRKNSILGLYELENDEFLGNFILMTI